MAADVVSQVEKIVLPILSSYGLELVDVEYRREGRAMVVRVFIDREGGVTLDDCSNVSREVSEILDVEESVPGRYTLEVSSPGLDRPLKREQDYDRFPGRLVKIRTYELFTDDAGNKRKTFLGTLLGLEGGIVKLHLKEGQMASIPLDKIAKANLEFDI